MQIADSIPSEMVHCLNYMSEISCSKYIYLCILHLQREDCQLINYSKTAEHY